MDTLVYGTVGNVTFRDTNEDERLNQGDDFIIVIASGNSYDLKIFWKQSGNQIAHIEWSEV
jgi:hypothetical protein